MDWVAFSPKIQKLIRALVSCFIRLIKSIAFTIVGDFFFLFYPRFKITRCNFEEVTRLAKRTASGKNENRARYGRHYGSRSTARYYRYLPYLHTCDKNYFGYKYINIDR